ECFPDTVDIHTKYTMSIDRYPKTEFSINQKEAHSLIESKILDANFDLTTDITSKLTDPLVKLLYGTVWKNGDRKKVKHIIEGIVDSLNEDGNQDKALVLYQFGKNLTKVPRQPIIDQHVIIAFSIHKMTDLEQVTTLRQMEIIGKRHKRI